jgi:hypothetical protein
MAYLKRRPDSALKDVADCRPGPLEEVILKEAGSMGRGVAGTPRDQVSEYLRDQVNYGHMTRLMARRVSKYLLHGFDVSEIAAEEGARGFSVRDGLERGLGKLGLTEAKAAEIHEAARRRRLESKR